MTLKLKRRGSRIFATSPVVMSGPEHSARLTRTLQDVKEHARIDALKPLRSRGKAAQPAKEATMAAKKKAKPGKNPGKGKK